MSPTAVVTDAPLKLTPCGGLPVTSFEEGEAEVISCRAQLDTLV